jgi:putative hemolysin
LAWSATDAQSCNAYSVPATAWTGAKATSGNNFPVVINQQTSFWLSCTGPGGVGTNYVTVFVSPSCPVGTLWNPATSRCENLVPVNSPTASITGDTVLTVGQTGTWNYSVADADGNLSRWRFRAGTNPGAGWTTISGSSRSGTYSQSFASPGTYTWVVDVEDAGGRTGTASINVIVTATGGDLCPNIAGTQSSVPTGMIVDALGNCVTAPIGGDLCPNIANTQSSVPVGMTIDASGNCVASGGTITQCSDSIDNDGDGNIDYPADSGCTGPTDDDENLAPTASITGSTALTVGQTGTWDYSVADADGNLSRWRFRAGTNPGAGWTTISGSSRSGTYSQSFASPGTYTWVVDVEDAKGAVGNATLSVTVTPVGVIPPTCPASYPDVTVTGVTGSGSVWGSGPYTDDSVFSRAAVHQGLISSGQTATIKRTSAGYVSSYVGSTRNGVTTSSYGAYCGMTLSLATVPPVIPTDLCPNIAGTQPSIPVGMTVDASGNCVASGPSLTPTLDLTADNYSVFFGLGTTLRWSSTNVTSCTASGNWSGSKSTSGSESTGGLWSDKTYTLMCTGPNGSVSKTIVINVGLAEACRDGNDNDGDGLIDYPADPGCTSPTDTDETDTQRNSYNNSSEKKV